MRILLALLFGTIPGQAQTLVNVAQNEFIAGRVPDAERTLRQALAAMDSGSPADSRIAAHQILATVLANQGKTREASEQIVKALALKPEGTRLGGIKHAMAMVSWSTGDLDTAARLMAGGVELLEGTPQVWEAKADQAALEMARGKKSRAAKLCNEALPMIVAIRGLHHPVAMTRAFSCAAITIESKPEDAEKRLSQLLDAGVFKLDVERAILLAQIARARLRSKNADAASSAINEAVALARASGDAPLLKPVLQIRAKVLRALKRKAEAAECEREVAALLIPASNAAVDARLLRTDAFEAKPLAGGLSR